MSHRDSEWEADLKQVIGLWALSLPDEVASVLTAGQVRDLKERIVALRVAGPTPSSIREAAREIADRWVKGDLPVEAAIQSLANMRLEALAFWVITKHVVVPREDVERGTAERLWDSLHPAKRVGECCVKCGHVKGALFTGTCKHDADCDGRTTTPKLCGCHCIFPSAGSDMNANQRLRSNHFDNAAIDKGMFPSHISRDGTAYYRDGSVLPPSRSAESVQSAGLPISGTVEQSDGSVATFAPPVTTYQSAGERIVGTVFDNRAAALEQSVLDEVEAALISIAEGVSPQIAVGRAFNIINAARGRVVPEHVVPQPPSDTDDRRYSIAPCPVCKQPALRADHWKESGVTYGPVTEGEQDQNLG